MKIYFENTKIFNDRFFGIIYHPKNEFLGITHPTELQIHFWFFYVGFVMFK